MANYQSVISTVETDTFWALCYTRYIRQTAYRTVSHREKVNGLRKIEVKYKFTSHSNTTKPRYPGLYDSLLLRLLRRHHPSPVSLTRAPGRDQSHLRILLHVRPPAQQLHQQIQPRLLSNELQLLKPQHQPPTLIHAQQPQF